MKNFSRFLRFRMIENRLSLALVIFVGVIGGAAAILYFGDTINHWLIIGKNRWGPSDVWKLVEDKRVQAFCTFIGGFWTVFIILVLFWTKLSPYFRKGVRNMTGKLTKEIPFELPEGQVPLNSPFYVERPPIEADCYEAISREDALIRIKAPRQMGKTSLMARVFDHAKHQGCQTVTVYFQQADSNIFADLDLFLQWFCATVSNGLNLEDRVETFWHGILGSKDKASAYFQKYLLPEVSGSLVLGMDEADLIFQYPKIATDFFALLRAWHERGKNEEIWKNLRLVIVHSQEVYIPLNINQSPFNVGLPIELPELTADQVRELIRNHGMKCSDDAVTHLMKMLGGHPYLIRAALYDIARKRITFKQLLNIAPTERGPYADHLRRHLSNVRENEKLLAAMKKVINVEGSVKIGEKETFKLRSLGLVKFSGTGNEIVPLCDLYRKYFRDRL